MPLVQDYSADEEEDGRPGFGGGSRLGGGAPGVSQSEPSKQDEPDFVPWERFVSANRDVSQREAGKLASGVEARAQDVTQRREDAATTGSEAVQSNYTGHKPKPSFSAALPSGRQESFGNFATSAPSSQAAKDMGMASAADQTSATLAQGGKVRLNGAQPQVTPQRVEPQPAINRDLLHTDTSTGRAVTTPKGLGGWADLEAQLGQAGWEKLVGDTVRAETEADMLGDEAGVQALLGQSYGNTGNAFDAALIGGAGGERFRELAQQFGGDALTSALGDANAAARSEWEALMTDAMADAARRDADINDFNDEIRRREAEEANQPSGGEAPTTPTGTQNPWGYGSFTDFMHDGGAITGIRDLLHGLVNDTSISNAAVDELGKAGVYQGNNVAEEFRKGVGLGGSELDMQNIRNTFRDVADDYGNAAAAWLFENMTPEQWASLGGMNTGAMYRVLQQIIEAAIASGAFVPPMLGSDGAKDSEVTAAGYTSGNSDYGTTDEQETARLNAYREGWGQEWDRQFREGNPNPQRP